MIYMNVPIEIHYIMNDGTKLIQQGYFPVRGRKRESIALEFWKQIKKEMSYRAELQKAICEGNDITQLVLEAERTEWRKRNAAVSDLPF